MWFFLYTGFTDYILEAMFYVFTARYEQTPLNVFPVHPSLESVKVYFGNCIEFINGYIVNT